MYLPKRRCFATIFHLPSHSSESPECFLKTSVVSRTGHVHTYSKYTQGRTGHVHTYSAYTKGRTGHVHTYSTYTQGRT